MTVSGMRVPCRGARIAAALRVGPDGRTAVALMACYRAAALTLVRTRPEEMKAPQETPTRSD